METSRFHCHRSTCYYREDFFFLADFPLFLEKTKKQKNKKTGKRGNKTLTFLNQEIEQMAKKKTGTRTYVAFLLFRKTIQDTKKNKKNRRTKSGKSAPFFGQKKTLSAIITTPKIGLRHYILSRSAVG